jgi:hypothetical protein
MSIKLDELRKRLLQAQSEGGPSALALPAPAASATEADPTLDPKASERTLSKPDLKAVEPSRPVESVVVKTVELSQIKDRERTAAPRREEPPLAAGGTRPAVSPLPKVDGSTSQNELAESVAKLFEQTKTFQARFDELAQAVDMIERMTDSAARLFGPLRAFHSQLSQLAVSFESMRAFQGQLAKLGKTFEPMRLLHDQLARLSDGVQFHVAELVKSLDPAKDFRDRITALARSMEQASELQAGFRELYSAFRPDSGTDADGSQREEPRQRAIS